MADTYQVTLIGSDLTTFIHNLRELLGGPLAEKVADELAAQIPIPVPDKLGAVVQTDQGQFIRWAFDAHIFIARAAGSTGENQSADPS